MTVTELIDKLFKIEAKGDGGQDVCVLQYNGGEDVPCDVNGIGTDAEYGLLMLQTTYR